LYQIVKLLAAAALGAAAAAALQERRVRSREMDTAYGMLNRAGVEARLRRLRGSVDMVYLDLDFLHDLNHALGEEAVDARIRQALNLRKSDMLFIGRWKSGDEIIVAVAPGEGERLAERLRGQLASHGLSATIGVVRAHNYHAAIVEASERVRRAKVANTRGCVVGGAPCC